MMNAFDRRTLDIAGTNGSITKLKLNKSADECGWLRRYSSTCPPTLQPKFNNYTMMCFHMAYPCELKTDFVHKLAKHRKAALVTDFRPIASVRLFYKNFACMILHRIQPCLDSCQPRNSMVSCWTTFGRTFAHRKFVPRQNFGGKHSGVVLSLDLSKAFDRVHWGALWLGLSEHGVSSHMLWILQKLYFGQHGEVTGQGGNSRTFQINASVRQGCVLSPKLLSSILHWAMSKWRTWLKDVHLDLIFGMTCHHFWI